SQRQNLDLITQQAAAELELIPMKQQQAQIAVDIMETEQQRAAIARQTAVDQARLSGQPSSRALEDADYRAQLVKAQIRAGIMSGQGMPQGAIGELIGLAKGRAGLEVAAL